MMPKRASLRQPSGPDSPRALGSIAEAGRRTSSSTSSEVTDARSDILFLISGAENHGVSVGTKNPRTPSSVRAQTTATSAMEPLVIHNLVTLRIKSSPTRLALVRITPGLDTKTGSVRTQLPMD